MTDLDVAGLVDHVHLVCAEYITARRRIAILEEEVEALQEEVDTLRNGMTAAEHHDSLKPTAKEGG